MPEMFRVIAWNKSYICEKGRKYYNCGPQKGLHGPVCKPLAWLPLMRVHHLDVMLESRRLPPLEEKNCYNPLPGV